MKSRLRWILFLVIVLAAGGGAWAIYQHFTEQCRFRLVIRDHAQRTLHWFDTLKEEPFLKQALVETLLYEELSNFKRLGDRMKYAQPAELNGPQEFVNWLSGFKKLDFGTINCEVKARDLASVEGMNQDQAFQDPMTLKAYLSARLDKSYEGLKKTPEKIAELRRNWDEDSKIYCRSKSVQEQLKKILDTYQERCAKQESADCKDPNMDKMKVTLGETDKLVVLNEKKLSRKWISDVLSQSKCETLE